MTLEAFVARELSRKAAQAEARTELLAIAESIVNGADAESFALAVREYLTAEIEWDKDASGVAP